MLPPPASPTTRTFAAQRSSPRAYDGFTTTDSSSDDQLVPVVNGSKLAGATSGIDRTTTFTSDDDDDDDAGHAGGRTTPGGSGILSAGGLSRENSTSRRNPHPAPFSRPPPAAPTRPPSAPPVDARAHASSPHSKRNSVGSLPSRRLSMRYPDGALGTTDEEELPRGKGRDDELTHEPSGDGPQRTKSKGKVREQPRGLGYAAGSTSFDPFNPLSALHTTPASLPSVAPSASASTSSASSHPPPQRPLSTQQGLNNRHDPSGVHVSSSSAHDQSQPPAPSLQDILSTVDLSAALLLVQTLQTQQTQKSPAPTPAPAPPPPATPPRAAPPPRTSRPQSQSRHPDTSPLPRSSAAREAPLPSGFSGSSIPLSYASNETQAPLLSSAAPPLLSISIATPPNVPERPRPTSVGGPLSPTAQAPGSNKKRTLSLSFGVGKRERTNSSASIAKTLGSPKVLERIPDERAALGEGGRDFEEQIARVHLSLSPATLRRAQNCDKYLTLRYAPVYDAIANGTPIPNLLSVSRSRCERAEAERMRRRQARFGLSTSRTRGVGGSIDEGSVDFIDKTANVLEEGQRPRSESSSYARKGPLSGLTPVFGPRRNKQPKAWEVYPDELEEFLHVGEKAKEETLLPGPQKNSTIVGGSTLRSATSGTTILSSNGSLERKPTLVSLASTSPSSFTSGQPHSRTTSLESSPLAQSTTRLSSNGPLPSSLNRTLSFSSSSSLGSHLSPVQPFASLTSINGSNERFHQRNGSIDQLLVSPPVGSRVGGRRFSQPNPPGVALRSPDSTASPQLKHNLSLGLRSNISRRLEKIRGKGTDGELSHAGGGSDRRERESSRPQSTNEVISTDASDAEGLSRSPSRIVIDLGSPFHRTSRLQKGSPHQDSFSKVVVTEAEGFKSAGEESHPHRGRRGPRARLWASAAWQGLRGAPGSEGNLEGRGRKGVNGLEQVRVGERSYYRRRRHRVEDSDDEEVDVPRVVVDLNDEEFTQLTGLIRQVKTSINSLDSNFIPRVAPTLNHFLEEMTRHEKSTLLSLGISVQYSFPRLSASIVSQLANSKAQEYSTVSMTGRADRDGSDSGSESSSESSSLASSGQSDVEEEIPFESPVEDNTLLSSTGLSQHHQHQQRSLSPSGVRKPSVRFKTARHNLTVKTHSRRVTDPISRVVQTRARSQTMGSPLSLSRVLVRPSTGKQVDVLPLLDRAIGDLENGTKELERQAGLVRETQDETEKGIRTVIARVDEVQSSIDKVDFQRLRALEEHFLRLRTTLTRPSATIDLFWTMLSYVITVLLWASWLVVSFVRIPVAVLRMVRQFLKWICWILAGRSRSRSKVVS